MKDELRKLLRAYTFLVLIILCIFGVYAGMLEARNNTRRLSFGEVFDTVSWNDIFPK